MGAEIGSKLCQKTPDRRSSSRELIAGSSESEQIRRWFRNNNYNIRRAPGGEIKTQKKNKKTQNKGMNKNR